MKNSRLMILAVLTLILVAFVGVSSVFAATETKITVNNAQVGKTYEIYKILDLTYSGVAGSENVAYTITTEWRSFFFSDNNGTKTTNGTTYLLDAQPQGMTLNRITYDVKGDGTEYVQYYLKVTSTNVAEFAQAALQYTTANNLTATDSKDATATTVEFKDMDLGYYLVYPKGATEITSGNASLASLTSTLPTTTVNVKATYLDIEKEDYEDAALQTEETGNVYVGQKVYYELTKSVVPDTTGYTEKYTYKIVDTLSTGLKSDFSDLVIKFGDTTITPSATELVKSTNTYTLDLDMRDYQAYKGQAITITYSATVTEDAVDSKTTKNTLVLSYSKSPKEYSTLETITEEEYVYSSEVVVNKVLEDNTTALAGAEFVLYKKDGNTKYYYKASNATSVINNTNAATVSTTAGLTNVEWVTNISEATHLTTDANGLATFKGLLDGTYYLSETQVPDGYNRRINDSEVTVAFRGVTETNDATSFDSTVNPGIFELVIVNITGTELPETGGIGTTLFITIGTALSVVAAIILVTNRRMSKETL